ncbi:multidrug efflux SMR transporter [uncultured Brevibacillus sp.]|uniref:DMT family transporter n=1 Tax=uncultured Brevibacillus sp. TaxID=169970 RepID=UPI002593F7D6|nr:multidrug efflux SMR transporter [uncultured Brevibacillus sp.]
MIWVSGLKHATAWWEWIITIAAILYSFKVLIDAAKKLPVGTVYAVFTGLGTGGTVMTEILLLNEPVHPLKLVFIAPLLTGVIGLKLVTRSDGSEKRGNENGVDGIVDRRSV